jgi:hypothetical protein
MGNDHARFLEGWGRATVPGYSTQADVQTSESRAGRSAPPRQESFNGYRLAGPLRAEGTRARHFGKQPLTVFLREIQASTLNQGRRSSCPRPWPRGKGLAGECGIEHPIAAPVERVAINLRTS